MGFDSARTPTVVQSRPRRRLSRTRRGPGNPGQREPAGLRAVLVGGRIEERVDLAREGGGRCPVPDDVDERGPPAAGQRRRIRPSCQPLSCHDGRQLNRIEEGGAEVRPDRPAGPRPPHPIRAGVGGAGPQQEEAAGRAGRPPPGLREWRRTGTLVSPEGLQVKAAGCGSLVLGDPLLALCEVLGRLPRVRPPRRGPATAPGSRSGPSCG